MKRNTQTDSLSFTFIIHIFPDYKQSLFWLSMLLPVPLPLPRPLYRYTFARATSTVMDIISNPCLNLPTKNNLKNYPSDKLFSPLAVNFLKVALV